MQGHGASFNCGIYEKLVQRIGRRTHPRERLATSQRVAHTGNASVNWNRQVQHTRRSHQCLMRFVTATCSCKKSRQTPFNLHTAVLYYFYLVNAILGSTVPPWADFHSSIAQRHINVHLRKGGLCMQPVEGRREHGWRKRRAAAMNATRGKETKGPSRYNTCSRKAHHLPRENYQNTEGGSTTSAARWLHMREDPRRARGVALMPQQRSTKKNRPTETRRAYLNSSDPVVGSPGPSASGSIFHKTHSDFRRGGGDGREAATAAARVVVSGVTAPRTSRFGLGGGNTYARRSMASALRQRTSAQQQMKEGH